MAFREEVQKYENNPGIMWIGIELLKRDDLKEKLENNKKSLKDCWKYIQECAKAGAKNGFNFMTNDQALSLAIHYYDEENPKVEAVTHEKVTFEQMEEMARNNATEPKKEVKKEVSKPKKKGKKPIEDKRNQISLFDFDLMD